MVFFNHQVSVDGTVRCLGASGGGLPDQVLRVDLPGLADDVQRVVVVASLTEGRLQAVTGLRLIVESDGGDAQGSGKVVFQQVSSSVIGRCGLRL